MNSDDTLTTGEAAKVCSISLQSIIRSIDEGRLKGSKVPGSRFRRVSRLELRRFIRKFNLPLDGLSADERCILLVSNHPTELAREVPLEIPRCAVKHVDTFEAGMLAAECRVSIIVIDDRLGATCIEQLLAKATSLQPPVPSIVLTSAAENTTEGVRQIPRESAAQTLWQAIESFHY